MNQQTTCPASLTDFSIDTIAECFGASPDLYQYLWNELVPRMPPVGDLSDQGPEPAEGAKTLAPYWNDIPAQHQEELRGIAAELDAECAQWLEEYEAQYSRR